MKVKTLSRLAAAGALLMTASFAIGAGAQGTSQAVNDTIPNAAVWGPLAKIGGTSWLNPETGEVHAYRWIVPGEILEVAYSSPKSRSVERVTLDPSGTRIIAAGGADDGSAYVADVIIPRPGIVVKEVVKEGEARRRIDRYDGDVRVSQVETMVDGAWVASGTPYEARRVSAVEAEAALAVLAKRQEEARQAEAAIPAQWGLLAQLAGQSFLSTSVEYPQYNSVMTYSWTKLGEMLTQDIILVASGKLYGRITYARDPATGSLSLQHNNEIWDVTLPADGIMRTTRRKIEREGVTTADYSLSGGNLVSESYSNSAGKKLYASTNTFTRVTGQSLEALRAGQQRQQQANAQVAAEEAEWLARHKAQDAADWGAIEAQLGANLAAQRNEILSGSAAAEVIRQNQARAAESQRMIDRAVRQSSAASQQQAGQTQTPPRASPPQATSDTPTGVSSSRSPAASQTAPPAGQESATHYVYCVGTNTVGYEEGSITYMSQIGQLTFSSWQERGAALRQFGDQFWNVVASQGGRNGGDAPCGGLDSADMASRNRAEAVARARANGNTRLIELTWRPGS